MLLMLLINLVAFVILRGLLDKIFEFKDVYFEGLPFYLGEPVLY